MGDYIHNIKCICKRYPRMKWPEVFVVVPREDDYVESLPPNPVVFRVGAVIHTVEKREEASGGELTIPIIKIELD